MKDVCIYEAEKLKQTNPPPRFFSMHRKEAEVDFMNMFLKEMGDTAIFLFLSTSDEKGAGNIVLYGDEKAIASLGNKYILSI